MKNSKKQKKCTCSSLKSGQVEKGLRITDMFEAKKKKQNRYLEELEELVGGDRVEHQRHVRGQRRDAKNDYKQQPLRPFISLKRLGKIGGGKLEKWKKNGGNMCTERAAAACHTRHTLAAKGLIY